MKTYTRIVITAAALLLPAWAFAECGGCCAAGKEGAAMGKCPMMADSAAVCAMAVDALSPVASDAKGLSEADAAFLAGYEKVHMALASDDFAAAKAEAAQIDGGAAVAGAKSIKEARVAFKALSEKAIALGKGHEGLYVIHCPMAFGTGADWLQPSKDVKNPYYGKSMLTCGYVKE